MTGPSPERQIAVERPAVAFMRSRMMAALGSCLNYLLLNVSLVVMCVPVVTIPISVNAATIALDRWRRDGEDRVVREFFLALRTRPPLGTTVLIGVPLVGVVVGVEEVHYFLLNGGNMMGHICFGLGLAAVLVTLTALGYVFALAARYPSTAATDLWRLSAQLAVRNGLVTGPLFTLEIAGAAAVSEIDPALLVVGLPIVLLNLMRVTAQFGLRRVEGERSR